MLQRLYYLLVLTLTIKRGRPSSSTENLHGKKRKHSRTKRITEPLVRQDQIADFPSFSEIKESCRYPDCIGIPKVFSPFPVLSLLHKSTGKSFTS